MIIMIYVGFCGTSIIMSSCDFRCSISRFAKRQNGADVHLRWFLADFSIQLGQDVAEVFMEASLTRLRQLLQDMDDQVTCHTTDLLILLLCNGNQLFVYVIQNDWAETCNYKNA